MDVVIFWISAALIAVTLGIKAWLTEGQPVIGWVKPNKDEQQFEKIEMLFQRYLTMTYIEMWGSGNEFSPQHRQIEEKLLGYAGDKLAQEMKKAAQHYVFSGQPGTADCQYRSVIDAFNEQLSEERGSE